MSLSLLNILNFCGIALFVVVFFSLCIFIHELGHFLAAKWRGLHVNAFSIGFKKIWGFKYKGVEYRIGCLPFGGYVDVPQLEPSEELRTDDGKPLPPAKPLDRIITAFAGPFCNILLGFFLGCFIWIFGVPQDTPKMREIKVANVTKDSPEYKSGLRKNDIIYSVNGRKFYTTWAGFVREILFTVGDVSLGVRRKDKKFKVVYTPKENPDKTPDEKLAYPFFTPELPVVLYPEKGSVAEKAGIKPNDKVLEINGEKIDNQRQYLKLTADSGGKPLNILVERGNGKVMIRNVKPVRAEGIYRIGITFNINPPISVLKVAEGSPAEKAGFKKGDEILTVNGHDASVNAAVMLNAINTSKGQSLKFKVNRGSRVLTLNVAPRLHNFYSIGTLLVFKYYPTPLEQFKRVISMSYKTLRGLFSRESSLKTRHLSGPLGIVRAITITVYKGTYAQVLSLIVMITFSLGLLNLLPLPVLDGGHICIALTEIVIRRPLPLKLIQPVTVAFIILLISLMLFITYYDAKRVYSDILRTKQAYSPQTRPPDKTSAENEIRKDVKNGSPLKDKKN